MNPDINNVETPDWIALGSSVLFFIALCIPMWVRWSIDIPEEVTRYVDYNASGNAGAQWGWVAIIGVIAVWAAWVLVMLGIDLPFPSAWLYFGGGGFCAFMTVLMMAIRPAGYMGMDIGMAEGVSKIPFVSAFIAIIAAAGIIVGGWLKFQEERY